MLQLQKFLGIQFDSLEELTCSFKTMYTLLLWRSGVSLRSLAGMEPPGCLPRRAGSRCLLKRASESRYIVIRAVINFPPLVIAGTHRCLFCYITFRNGTIKGAAKVSVERNVSILQMSPCSNHYRGSGGRAPCTLR